MNLRATLDLDNRGFMHGLRAARTSMGGFTSGLRGVLAPLAAATAGLLGVASAAAALRRAVGEAAEMEDFEASLTTLLGSADAARERLAALTQFADTTPFELPEVVRASKVLETLTRGALATGEGLRMVGDIAATTGEPFGEIAVHVGRLYDGLQNGRPVGEAMQRLQELGVLSGVARGRIEALQKEGAKGEQVWSVATAAFGRFAGEMQRRSQTFNGLMSTLRDGIRGVFREFGAPVRDALKPLLEDGIGLMDALKTRAAAAGATAAEAIGAIRQAFVQDRVGELAGATLKLGFGEAANFLARALKAGLHANLDHLTSGTYWGGMAQLALAAFEGIGATLTEVFLKPVFAMQAALDTAVQQYTARTTVLGLLGVVKPKSFEENLEERVANNPFAGLLESLRGDATTRGERGLDQVMQSFAEAQRAAIEGFKDATGVVDTDQLAAELKALVDELAQAQASVSRASAGGAGPENEPHPGMPASRRSPGRRAHDEGDRLARIGGFLGGFAAPTIEHARRTADNTAKMTRQLEQIRAQLRSSATQSAPRAVWG